METINALEGSFGSAAPLFKAGQFRSDLRGFLLEAFALLTHQGKLGLQFVEAGLGLRMFGLKACGLFALLVDGLTLGFAGVLVARCLQKPLLQTAFNALR